MTGRYHDVLKEKIDAFILNGYKVSKSFPRDEQSNMTSQCRRALLSIMLNYLEGYARTKKKVTLNFYETSFGSLKEAIYVFHLALRLGYTAESDYKTLFIQKEEIARMLWKSISGLRRDIAE